MAFDDTTGFAFGQEWLSEDVDELDRRIIARLQIDGRMPAKAIADEVSVSEVTVRKRLARLLDEQVIEVVAVPNALASDRTIMAMAQIRSAGDAESLGEQVAELPEVAWLAIGAGHVDLVCGIVCDGRKAFEDVLRRLHALEGVAHLETFVYLKVLKQLYVGPLDGNGGNAGANPPRGVRPWMPGHIDDVDLTIIAQLQGDGRTSVKSMADWIGLSEATIRKRLARLLDDGLIQIAAIPNARGSAQPVMALANMRVRGDVESLGREAAAWQETSWVALGAGNVDLAVEVVCSGRDSLRAVIKRLQSLDGVTHLQTFVYLRTLKQAYIGPLTVAH